MTHNHISAKSERQLKRERERECTYLCTLYLVYIQTHPCPARSEGGRGIEQNTQINSTFLQTKTGFILYTGTRKLKMYKFIILVKGRVFVSDRNLENKLNIISPEKLYERVLCVGTAIKYS